MSMSTTSTTTTNILGRQSPFVPLSVPYTHLTGLYFGINGVAFHALFDSGSDGVVLPTFVTRDANIDLRYRKMGTVHRFGQDFVRYRAPIEVVDGPSVVTTVDVSDFLPALVPPQIFTPYWSIEFTAAGVRFMPCVLYTPTLHIPYNKVQKPFLGLTI
jgi:hypothetical protein